MKPSARVQTAIDLLSRIETGRIPMDNVIRDFMAARRYIGSKDRTAIVERVYRIVRAHARLTWWIDQSGIDEAATPVSRLKAIADLALNEGAGLEAIAALFDGDKYAPSPLTAPEEKFIGLLQGKQPSATDQLDFVRGECPPWAYPKLQSIFGDEFESHMAAMIDPAPLDLRVNTIKGSVDDAIDSLRKDKVDVEKTPYSPVGLRAKGKPFMSDTKAFRGGLVEIQDEGSQLIGLLCGVKPGMRVLDYCAGGGGKTLVLAAMMENKGNIVATDNDPRRLEKGRPRYKKAGVHNVELRSLSEEQNRKWLRRQKGTMDVVLVDAPCSSSGTWRRNPDLRWNTYGPSLEEIMAMQSDILSRVADKVKPGGRLVYATCSLFREENEDQVEAFIAAHPDYEVLPIDDIWSDFGREQPCAGPYLRLNPRDHGTDGFFTAVLRRKS